MIREDLRVALTRWREVLAGGAVALAGAWAALRAGDPFFAALSAMVAVVGLAFAFLGWRRVRFAAAPRGPGIVQVVEGQVSFFGPETGGFVALRELAELQLADGGRVWRLIPAEGESVDIPLGARGAEALFDAFATLPGIDMARVLAAQRAPLRGDAQVLWRHPQRGARLRALT